MPIRAAIYLDANAGAPLRAEALEALRALILNPDGEHPFANPSSSHEAGRRARRLLTEARSKVAASLNLPGDDGLIFTSSGTEANQLAVRGALESLGRASGASARPARWITSPVEHDSVLALVDWARRQGIEVDLLAVDADGRPDPSSLAEKLGRTDRAPAALVSLTAVNHETGVQTDVAAIAGVLRAYARALMVPRPLLHVDAAQAWGKLPLDLATLGADFVTLAGHKIGALAGVGVLALVTPAARKISPVITGAQEQGLRGGTENLLGIVSLGAAAAALDPSAYATALAPLRDRFEQALVRELPETVVHGQLAPRVANTSHFRVRGIEESLLVAALDLAGFCVSSGSACASRVPTPSPTLLALGLTDDAAKSAVRVSLPEVTDTAGLDRLVVEIARIARARLARPDLGSAASRAPQVTI